MNKQNSKKYFKNIAIILMIAIFFIADRYLKFLAAGKLAGESFALIGNIFTFNFTPNYYIAFSLPIGGLFLNILIGLIIAAILIFLTKSIKDKKNLILLPGFLLILSGAISNFIDRLSYGYVIDYLYLKHFTVFNIADACISLGAIIILFSLYKKPSR